MYAYKQDRDHIYRRTHTHTHMLIPYYAVNTNTYTNKHTLPHQIFGFNIYDKVYIPLWYGFSIKKLSMRDWGKVGNGPGRSYCHISTSIYLVVVFESHDYITYYHDSIENHACRAFLMEIEDSFVNTKYKNNFLHFCLASHLIQIALELLEGVACERQRG